MRDLMGGEEIYHYHSKVINNSSHNNDHNEQFKLMMKEAKTGGSFVWHQDYGYWYHNGCLRPEMGSIFIAIDKLKLIFAIKKC